MTLGQKIKEARGARGLTQKQLSGDCMTPKMLSKIENDFATPSLRTVEYLAEALEKPVSYFIDSSEFPDGSGVDGLDNMRDAYRAGKWETCMELLQKSWTAGATDEGYLLRARAGAAAAREALERGDIEQAVSFAEEANYYNKEGLYYSHRIDAEMSLILAESALWSENEGFEQSIAGFEKAALSINYYDRYLLDKVEYLLACGNTKDAETLLESSGDMLESQQGRYLYLKGRIVAEREKYSYAAEILLDAEKRSENQKSFLPRIYENLEICYREMGDYERAYHYASKQLR